jgi:hypothetical protein
MRGDVHEKLSSIPCRVSTWRVKIWSWPCAVAGLLCRDFPCQRDCVFTTTLSRPLTPRNSPWQTLKGLLISMPLPQVSNPLSLYVHSFILYSSLTPICSTFRLPFLPLLSLGCTKVPTLSRESRMRP